MDRQLVVNLARKSNDAPRRSMYKAIMLSLVRFYPVYVNNLIHNFAAKETEPSSREKTHSAKRNVSRSKLKLNEVCVTLNSSLERERKREWERVRKDRGRRGVHETADAGKGVRGQREALRGLGRRMPEKKLEIKKV